MWPRSPAVAFIGWLAFRLSLCRMGRQEPWRVVAISRSLDCCTNYPGPSLHHLFSDMMARTAKVVLDGGKSGMYRGTSLYILTVDVELSCLQNLLYAVRRLFQLPCYLDSFPSILGMKTAGFDDLCMSNAYFFLGTRY